jgi:hypothetical protein
VSSFQSSVYKLTHFPNHFLTSNATKTIITRASDYQSLSPPPTPFNHRFHGHHHRPLQTSRSMYFFIFPFLLTSFLIIFYSFYSISLSTKWNGNAEAKKTIIILNINSTHQVLYELIDHGSIDFINRRIPYRYLI